MLGGAGGFAYAASKHAVVGITRQLAVELGPLGIRTNAFSPGATRTPITDAARVERLATKFPLRRPGQPDEQAAAALFLASDDASYVNGQILAVDGGWTASAV